MGQLTFTTTVERRGPAAAILLDDDQVAALGAGRTPPVLLTVGEVTVATRVGRMGGENLLGLSKERRLALGIDAGDTVEVTVVLDEGPREVTLPPELESALASDPAARAAFDALAPSRRKELARGIAEAKQPATRERRLAAVLETLRG